ncbi:hypothetical protein FDUTEX481_06791 [Tolypothrix sp. PCC 7601]|nr:hypothetical protein FDUTEX481_06791 [Tolypothrix sp. PCC 7601]BAY88526.1 hypothetical protein NIES3275_05010 [Microchaete diplosiphon NIES-3275]
MVFWELIISDLDYANGELFSLKFLKKQYSASRSQKVQNFRES